MLTEERERESSYLKERSDYKKNEPSFFFFSHKKFAHPEPERELSSSCKPQARKEKDGGFEISGMRREVRLR